MAKLTPDATRTEHGLVINEKIIPWGAVWPKDSGAYKKGTQYKADRLLSGGTGKVKGVTIHNTNDLFLSTPSARRATLPFKRLVKDRVISIHALCEEGDLLRCCIPFALA